MKAKGRIRPGLGGAPVIRYEPLPEDFEKMREAVILLCRMMFAAGASEVYPGVTPFPEIVYSMDDVDALERIPVVRRDFHMLASHLFGTARAGADPTISVVRPDLRAHGVERLYVMDASVFPTNLGVNPQHSVMAVIFGAAERLANQAKIRRAA
jgi:choline dehydrogenase-like flavoprotein